MKKIIDEYHLHIGLLLSVALPGLFVFQETIPERMVIRFISSGLFIFFLWAANFALVDFNERKLTSNKMLWYGKVVVAFLLTAGCYILIGFTIDSNETMLSQVRGVKFTSFKSWFYLIIRLSLLNVLILIIKYVFDVSKEKRQIELENALLKRENLAAMHEVLKQQLKPHFLFNSLSTLSALVKREPDLAEKFITELTKVYRYMIAHQSKEMVQLREEVDFVISYLFLLKIRFGDAIRFDIQVPDEALITYIPPNTLQLLIENAVKHNSFSQNKPLKILLYINDPFLIVENNFRPKDQHEESSNLGLKNIDSRYKLLFNKNVVIKNPEDCFQVLLPLNKTYGDHNHRR